MKVKAKIKNGRTLIKVSLSFSDKLNEREMDLMAKNAVPGVMKPMQKRKRLYEYVGPVTVSLKDRLKRPLTRHEFLLIMSQINNICRRMRSKGLNPQTLYLDTSYIYIGEQSNELHFIFIPLEKRASSADALDLMNEIIYDSKAADEENPDFILNFSSMLRELDDFSPDRINEYISSADNSVAGKDKKGNSGYLTDKPQDYLNHYNNNSNNYNYTEEDTTILGNYQLKQDDTGYDDWDEYTGKLNFSEETEMYSSEDNATGFLGGQSDFKPAEEKQAGSRASAVLKRVKTGEKIEINKPVFRLGKESGNVDYCVGDNNSVSRKHADMIIRGGKAFVRDLNSKNRTYINGSMIAPDCETEIFDGDKLTLANEEFTFYFG